jgi:hypothetical protein
MTIVGEKKEFLKSPLVTELEPGVFKIRVDLKTRKAGVDHFIIGKNQFKSICEEYTSEVSDYGNVSDLLYKLEYALLDLDEITYRVNRILKYLYQIVDLIQSIIDYFSKTSQK